MTDPRTTRVLVAEDDYLVCEEISRLLRQSGYQRVATATNGEAAVTMTGSLHPDVVLMDIQMPKLDGLTATRAIQERCPTPVVVLTAYESAELVATASECGVSAYLTKPPQRAEIERAITMALARHGDLMASRRLSRELNAKTRELEAKNAELDQFTYTVSHDLKSPLITIQGFTTQTERALAVGDTTKIARSVRHIRRAADKMERLIDALLELSRLGRFTNPPVKVALAEVVAEAVELLAGRIQERGVRIDVSPELPVVEGDRVRLVELLQNLIDNAVKFMGDQPAPRVEVGVRKDGRETVCFVRDNGAGLEARHHESIFRVFTRMHPEQEGTGIGLALVKRIVELHGGRIWVESDGPGCGSAFCFTVP